jgi:hypothetical protein
MEELLTFEGWVTYIQNWDLRLIWAGMILVVLIVLYRQNTLLGWIVRLLLWGSIVWIWFLASPGTSGQFYRNWFVTGLCALPIVVNLIYNCIRYTHKQNKEARAQQAKAVAESSKAAAEAAATKES